MSTKNSAADDKKATTVVVNDPDDPKGTLKHIGGSKSDHWNGVLANQTIQTLWLKHPDKETSDHQLSATVAGLVGIGPKDELEGMIAAQLLAAHNAAMECYRRAMIGEQSFEGRDGCERRVQFRFGRPGCAFSAHDGDKPSKSLVNEGI